MSATSIKSLIFDYRDLGNRMTERLNEEISNGIIQWPFVQPPAPGFVSGFLFALARDVCEKALHAFLRPVLLSNVDDYLDMNVPGITDDAKKWFTSIIMDIGGVDFHNEILHYIGIPTYNVWTPVIEDGLLQVHLEGDFRILQWEQEHIENGEYRATICNTRIN